MQLLAARSTAVARFRGCTAGPWLRPRSGDPGRLREAMTVLGDVAGCRCWAVRVSCVRVLPGLGMDAA